MLVEGGANLDLVEWNECVIEEVNVFFFKRNDVTTDDAGIHVKELTCSIKLVSFMNQVMECILDRRSNNLSSLHKFNIKYIQNLLMNISFFLFFRIRKSNVLMNKAIRNPRFQIILLNWLIINQLLKDFINAFNVLPCWFFLLHLFISCNFTLALIKFNRFKIRESPKEILLNHLHELLKLGNHQWIYLVLVTHYQLYFSYVFHSLDLTFFVF